MYPFIQQIDASTLGIYPMYAFCIEFWLFFLAHVWLIVVFCCSFKFHAYVSCHHIALKPQMIMAVNRIV